MKSANPILSIVTALAVVLVTACGPQNTLPEEPVGGYPPGGGPPGTGPAGGPGGEGGPGGDASLAPAPTVPTLPPRPQGSECAAWTPSSPINDADALVSEVNGTGIVAMQQLSCRSGALNPPPCDIETCEAWVRFLAYDSLVAYQKFETDTALEEALKAVKKGRECGIQGELMARAYIALGYVLADANGEMMKASNAFRWAFLHKWDVALPFADPPPTVEMTFKAAKASMGTTTFGCQP
jgi:hypothetical protein